MNKSELDETANYKAGDIIKAKITAVEKYYGVSPTGKKWERIDYYYCDQFLGYNIIADWDLKPKLNKVLDVGTEIWLYPIASSKKKIWRLA